VTYATLAFRRVRYKVFEVAGERREKFEYGEAKEYFDKEIEQPWQAYLYTEARRSKVEQAFRNRVEIRHWQEIERSTGGLFKPPRPTKPVDEVILNGQVVQVEPGKAEDFVDAEARRRFPVQEPPSVGQASNFEQWYQGIQKEIREWRAEFIVPAEVAEIPIENAPRRGWGFPITEALRELDRLEKQGWRIVHVSEDHGLYAGADTTDEAYLTRVRYLLHNSTL
jgi:hypothetical protein